MRQIRSRIAIFLSLSATLLCPSAVQGQERQPFTLEQIEGLLAAGITSTQVILEMVGEDCLAFRVAEAEEALSAAGASAELIQALRTVCYAGPEPEVEVEAPVEAGPTVPPSSATLFNPGAAAMKSLAIPGLGQFSTGRPAVGAVFLAAWAGAIGFGVMSEKVTVECLARTTGTCPEGDIRGETAEKSKLLMGLGAAAGVAIISALEARSGANRANLSRQAFLGRASPRKVVLEVLPAVRGASGRDLVLLQLRHR